MSQQHSAGPGRAVLAAALVLTAATTAGALVIGRAAGQVVDDFRSACRPVTP